VTAIQSRKKQRKWIQKKKLLGKKRQSHRHRAKMGSEDPHLFPPISGREGAIGRLFAYDMKKSKGQGVPLREKSNVVERQGRK